MTEPEQPGRLAPDLAALFAKESSGYGAYAATQDAAYGSILDRLALVAPPAGEGGGAPDVSAALAAGAATKAAVSAKVAALVAVTALTVGVVVGRASVPVAPAPSPVPKPSVAVPDLAPAPLPSDAAAPDRPAPITSASAWSRVAAPATPSVAAPQGTLAQERELVEGARAALTRGRPADALAATDLHARLFPRGRLAEEREVLAITALTSLGRTPEAEARRARFLHAYPDSLLAPPPFAADDGGRP